MTRPSGQGGRRKTVSRDQRRPARDSVVYAGILIIVLFGLGLWYLISPDTLREAVVGAVIAVAFLVNLYTVQAYRGRSLAHWQQALARLPLRVVGYGKKGGRSLTVAHGRPEVRLMLFVSIAVSVLIILAVTYWLIPGARP